MWGGNGATCDPMPSNLYVKCKQCKAESGPLSEWPDVCPKCGVPSDRNLTPDMRIGEGAR